MGAGFNSDRDPLITVYLALLASVDGSVCLNHPKRAGTDGADADGARSPAGVAPRAA